MVASLVKVQSIRISVVGPFGQTDPLPGFQRSPGHVPQRCCKEWSCFWKNAAQAPFVPHNSQPMLPGRVTLRVFALVTQAGRCQVFLAEAHGVRRKAAQARWSKAQKPQR
jgi:hypothetical protein